MTVVSFAAYRIGSVTASLDAAVRRGVDFSMVLESSEMLKGAGEPRLLELPHLRVASPGGSLRTPSFMPRPSSSTSRRVLTSANMTSAAYHRNIELGVLCHGGGVAAQVQRHFDALIARCVLRVVDP